jgi:hypothetical protein
MLPKEISRLLNMIQHGHRLEQAHATYMLVSILREVEKSNVPLEHPTLDKLKEWGGVFTLVPWTPPTPQPTPAPGTNARS